MRHSSIFYPVNLTNPDPERPELPRLVQATEAQLAVMRGHVAGLASRRGLGDGSEDVGHEWDVLWGHGANRESGWEGVRGRLGEGGVGGLGMLG